MKGRTRPCSGSGVPAGGGSGLPVRLAVVLAALAATWLASALPAAAHAVLLEPRPADGTELEAPPEVVLLQFDEPVEVPPDGVRVYDQDADRVGGHVPLIEDVLNGGGQLVLCQDRDGIEQRDPRHEAETRPPIAQYPYAVAHPGTLHRVRAAHQRFRLFVQSLRGSSTKGVLQPAHSQPTWPQPAPSLCPFAQELPQ